MLIFCTWQFNFSPINTAVNITPDDRQQTDLNFIVKPLFKNCLNNWTQSKSYERQ